MKNNHIIICETSLPDARLCGQAGGVALCLFPKGSLTGVAEGEQAEK